MVQDYTIILFMTNSLEKNTLRVWAERLPQICVGLNGAYFQALRAVATEALGVPIGRVIPAETEDVLVRVTAVADRQRRPYAVVERLSDQAKFVLLVDTKKNLLGNSRSFRAVFP